MQRITRHIGAWLVIAVVAVAGTFLAHVAASRENTREIHLMVRDMAFRFDADAAVNPTLELSPGEQVRLTLRNEDRGMVHDFSIPQWGVQTGNVQWGEEKTITFKVPHGGGAPTYICTPHSAMMSGRIVIAK